MVVVVTGEAAFGGCVDSGWGRRRDKGAGGEPGLRAKRPGATD